MGSPVTELSVDDHQQINKPVAKAIAIPAEWDWRVRLSDYVELSKIRISVMVLATVAVGFAMGARGNFDFVLMLNALLGVGLVAAASSMFNQVFERNTDALMPRTENRPLAAGRIFPVEAIIGGSLFAIYGTMHLLLFVNVLTAMLTLSTLIMYVLIYTPLKRVTSFCTTIGAIPGALPPVLGWTAAGQGLTVEAFWMFAIMFLWQFPHFLAIAWKYKEQYANAGLFMLPGQMPRRYVTGSIALLYAVLLLPASLMPFVLGMTGPIYAVVATLLGASYIYYAARFTMREARETARKLLFCSLFYLPIILTALTCSYLGR